MHRQEPETPLIEYRFNKCGHRTEMECGPKPPGTIGLSWLVRPWRWGGPYRKKRHLRHCCCGSLATDGRRVEVYDEAYVGRGNPHNIAVRFKDVQAAEPDMILWIMTPFDIENTGSRRVRRRCCPRKPGNRLLARVRTVSRKRWPRVPSRMRYSSLEIPFNFVHDGTLLVRESESLCEVFPGGAQSGVLRAEPSQEWKEDLQRFDSVAADVEGRAKAAACLWLWCSCRIGRMRR